MSIGKRISNSAASQQVDKKKAFQSRKARRTLFINTLWTMCTFTGARVFSYASRGYGPQINADHFARITGALRGGHDDASFFFFLFF